VTDKRPLHVRTAEALGWVRLVDTGGGLMLPGEPTMWLGLAPSWWNDCGAYVLSVDQNTKTLTFGSGSVPRFDTDWSAGGRLIERFSIGWDRCVKLMSPPLQGDNWIAVVVGVDAERPLKTHGDGDSPLKAMCELIIRLKERDRLRVTHSGMRHEDSK
jgi:hypothetical protein